MEHEAHHIARQAEAEAEARQRMERQRRHCKREIEPELKAVAPQVRAAGNVVLESNRSRLSQEGVAQLEAYIGRFPRWFKSVAAEKMLAGASLENALAGTVEDFARRTDGKVKTLLRERKYRARTGESAS